MHPKFQNLLCCPETKEPLHLKPAEVQSNGLVVSGELISPSGRSYPIVRGIPRFVSEEQYASSFGYEWNRWPRVQFEDANVGKPMAGHTTRMWEINTGAGNENLRGKTIVEFGCGPGRFLDVVRHKGGQAVGIDLSQAVESARRNFADDPDVLIVQGDILNPPFREGVFDGGYSIGVLHHTPNPLTGLQALTQTVKPGGWIACTVYPKGEFYDYPAVAHFRRLHHFLSPKLGYRPALYYSYLSAYLLTPVIARSKRIPGLNRLLTAWEQNWLVTLPIPDARWRLLDIFDAITPTIATTHTGKEVRGWMKEAGCANIQTTDWCETSVVGLKA